MDDDDRSAVAARYVLPADLASRLDALLGAVSATLAFPTVRVNVLDAALQHTVRMCGPGSPAAVDRDEAFCDTVVRTGAPVIVPDAAHDPRFAAFPAVGSGEIGAYLGVPLRDPDETVIGALCLVDAADRAIGAEQLRVLLQFGRVVERHLETIRADRDRPAAAAATDAGRRDRRGGRTLDG